MGSTVDGLNIPDFLTALSPRALHTQYTNYPTTTVKHRGIEQGLSLLLFVSPPCLSSDASDGWFHFLLRARMCEQKQTPSSQGQGRQISRLFEGRIFGKSGKRNYSGSMGR